jgi:hypothetical protein
VFINDDICTDRPLKFKVGKIAEALSIDDASIIYLRKSINACVHTRMSTPPTLANVSARRRWISFLDPTSHLKKWTSEPSPSSSRTDELDQFGRFTEFRGKIISNVPKD